MSGFITLHRRLLDWEWYSDINTKTLFIHCLLKANWEDKNWQGVNVKRGSFITSNQSLSAETKLTIQQIRTSIFKLTKTNEINIQTTNKYTLLTIVKYDDYQNLEIKPTNKQQSNNKQSNNQITTTNNIINKQLNINNILLSEIEISDVREDLKNQNKEPISEPISELSSEQIESKKKINNKDIVDWDKLLIQFNEITGKKTKVLNSKTKNSIIARLKEGYEKKDLLVAIQNCYKDPYHKETNHKYLTLEFISRPDKMEKYSTMKI